MYLASLSVEAGPVARAQRPLGSRLCQVLSEPVEGLAGILGSGVEVEQRQQLGGAHRVARVVPVRGGDEVDHPALDPEERDEVGRGRDDPAHAQRPALQASQAHVLAIGDLRQLLRGLAPARHAHPFGGGRSEALRGGEGDVLGRPIRLGEDPIPERLRRAAYLIQLRHWEHVPSFATVTTR